MTSTTHLAVHVLIYIIVLNIALNFVFTASRSLIRSYAASASSVQSTSPNGPMAEYQKRIDSGHLRHDAHQVMIVQQLENLHSTLEGYVPSNNTGWLSKVRRI